MTRKTTVRLLIIVPLLALMGWGSWYGANKLAARRLDIRKAVEIDDCEAVAYILKWTSIDVNASIGDPYRYTGPTNLLAVAAERGHLDMVKLLLQHGADPNMELIRNAGVTLPGGQQYQPVYLLTPLWYASWHGDLEMARALLESGADPDLPTDEWEQAAINVASYDSDWEIVKLLLAYGADPNMPKEYRFPPGLREEYAKEGHFTHRDRPLIRAIEAGRWDVVKLLIERGAELDTIGHEGYSPLLDEAIRAIASDVEESCSEEFILQLIRSGANVEERVFEDATPLHRATCFRGTKVLKALLDAGADVNAQTQDKITPLRWAVGEGPVENVEFLLKHGANPNLADDDGIVPLHYSRNLAIVKLLLAAGAQVNTVNKDGETPLDCYMDDVAETKQEYARSRAVSLEQAEKQLRETASIIELLRKHGARTGEELKAEQGKID